MRRGEIWWTEDPEAGRRPHLVLTRDSAIPLLRGLLAVPATRTIRGIPSEVRIGPEQGMPTECVLSLDNVGIVSKGFFVERICVLDGVVMDRVCRALALASGCRF